MKTNPMTEKLYRYVVDHCEELHPVLRELERDTEARSDSVMMISHDQGVFMNLLAKVAGVRRYLEVGCYTGHSALAVALGLPEDGEVVSLDVDEKVTATARQYFEKAEVSHKITVKLGDALKSLAALEAEGHTERYDMMFIDADKENMVRYYEYGLKLVRPGGLILADNALWGGSVVDDGDQKDSTAGVRAFNQTVREDDRVEKLMLHISDGIYVLRKK